VLLASDAAYGAPSLTEGVPPGAVTDRAAAVASLSWVRAFARRPDCAAVLPNHDPGVTPGRIARAEPESGLWAEPEPGL
jgi:hypothetical protein